jgi:hypothetical protein
MSFIRILFTPFKEEFTSVSTDSHFSFTPPRKNAGRAKRYFSKLKKLGAIRTEFREVPMYVETVNSTGIYPQVQEQYEQCCHNHKGRPTRLIIGAKNWKDLLYSPEMRRDYTSFQQPDLFQGMKIEIVPWLDGILVLP